MIGSGLDSGRWDRSPRGFLAGLTVWILVALVVVGVAVVSLSRRHPLPYMSGDSRVTLIDGRTAPDTSIDIAEAIALQSRRPRLVRGYLVAPMDDRPRLCARIVEYVDCRGEPRLLIANLGPGALFGYGPQPIKGLKHGCCSVGFWSPRRLAVRGVVVGNTLYLVPSLP